MLVRAGRTSSHHPMLRGAVCVFPEPCSRSGPRVLSLLTPSCHLSWGWNLLRVQTDADTPHQDGTRGSTVLDPGGMSVPRGHGAPGTATCHPTAVPCCWLLQGPQGHSPHHPRTVLLSRSRVAEGSVSACPGLRQSPICHRRVAVWG